MGNLNLLLIFFIILIIYEELDVKNKQVNSDVTLASISNLGKDRQIYLYNI